MFLLLENKFWCWYSNNSITFFGNYVGENKRIAQNYTNFSCIKSFNYFLKPFSYAFKWT